ncbi:MAG: YcjF family protein [Bacilli bacterium]
MKKQEEKKITLEEYQKKYTSTENIAAAKTFLFILGAGLGIIIATALFFVVLRLFEIHEIAGYCGIAAAILIFILFYIVPLTKLKNMPSFKTNVKGMNARRAQKHNKKLREDIADKMIDVTLQTEDISWYSDSLVNQLAVARQIRNDGKLKETLTEIYKKDVKNAANKMINRTAVKVGVATALSQSEYIDTLFVLIYDLKLIKDIVFLYGYRPSDTQMVKIYKTVLTNAVVAYGLSSATNNVGKIVSKVISSPVVSAFAGPVIESAIQGFVNSTFTAIIGFQTKQYLAKEYKLQDILDQIELVESEDEQIELIKSIEHEVKEKAAKKTKVDKKDLVTD